MTPSSRPADSPAAVVLAALAARTAGDWRALAALADPASVREWREVWLDGNLRVPTVEALAAEHPEASREALQRLIDTHLAPACRDFEARLQDYLPGVRTAAEAEALGEEELLARYLEADDPRYGMRRLFAAAGKPAPDAFDGALAARRFRVVREERAGPNLATVTWREVESEGMPPLQDEEVTWTLRRQPAGDWRIVADLEFRRRGGQTAFVIDDPDVAAYMHRVMQGGPNPPAA